MMPRKEIYWWWKNFISKKDIQKINKCKPVFDVDNYDTKNKKTSKVIFLPYNKIKKYLNDVINTCYISNHQNFGFDLYHFDENSNVSHNTYSSKNKGRYDWHVDINTDYKYDIKFTVLINVSEEKYSGGKFKLMHGGKPEHVKELDEPGNMIMFRSYTLHKVEPVTKGERKTLTLFLTGPNFK